MKRFLMAAGVALSGGLWAHADEITLTNGHKIVGIQRKDSRDPKKVIIEVGTGTIVLDAQQVSSVNPGRTLLNDYEDKYNAIRGSTKAADYVALAQWAKDNRLTRYIAPLCGEILKIDPQNETAHRMIGHERFGHEWLTFEQAQEKRGLRLVDDRWMSKAEAELVEKHRLEAREREEARRQERERRKEEERERRRREAEEYAAWYARQIQDLDGYFYRPDWCWPAYFRPYPWASYVRSRRNYQYGNFYGGGALGTFDLFRFIPDPFLKK